MGGTREPEAGQPRGGVPRWVKLSGLAAAVLLVLVVALVLLGHGPAQHGGDHSGHGPAAQAPAAPSYGRQR